VRTAASRTASVGSCLTCVAVQYGPAIMNLLTPGFATTSRIAPGPAV
jgi:hypothetical protein